MRRTCLYPRTQHTHRTLRAADSGVRAQQDEHQHAAAAAAAAESDGRHEMDCAHLATTYTALCTLRVLGDDFSRLDRAAILSAIKHLQQPDGRSPPSSPPPGSAAMCVDRVSCVSCAVCAARVVCGVCGGKVQLQRQRGRQRE